MPMSLYPVLNVEDRYQLLVEHSCDIVYLADDDSRFVWVSPVAKRIAGWDPDQLIGP
jgi:PAS domain S-box-containing protein